MLKKVMATILSIILIFSCFGISSFAQDDSDTLRFNSDGKFKIVVFADCQDTESPSAKMIKYIGQALDTEKPDMVVFTGDNVVVSTESKFLTGAQKLIQPLIERNIPYAYTYGNHDAEYGVSKAYQFSVYKSLGRCLSRNEGNSLTGYANCNIPIYSSTGDDIAFNLWIIDSNMYYSDSSQSKYDNVHQDQLDWFVSTDQALEASQGHKVNSIVFQHIALPEIYNCLTESSTGSKTFNGKRYKQSLNSSARGYLGEWPCPPSVNSGEFAVLKSRGDVLGVVTGHDHSNSFVGTYDGIDFIQMPGMTFHSYGDDNARGYGVIELDESDTSTYRSHTVRYIDAYTACPITYQGINNDYYSLNSPYLYISDIMFSTDSSESTARRAIINAGYEFINYDLNKGAKGNYVFMGIKRTNNYEDAIKDIRFFSEDDGSVGSSINIPINGKPCVYRSDLVDLNKGSGGDYIYGFYSRDPLAGPGITDVYFDTAVNPGSTVCGTLNHPDSPADLNKGTTTHNNAVYCYISSNVNTVDISELDTKYQEIILADTDEYSEYSVSALESSLATADNYLSLIKNRRFDFRNQNDVDDMTANIKDSYGRLTKYKSDSNYLYGIASPTRPEDMVDKFNISYASVSFRPSTWSYMGTGSKVDLEYDGRYHTYTTVTYGDVTGDAWYDGQDAMIVRCLCTGLLTRDDIGEAAYIAADCNHDGLIDELDVAILEEAGVLLSRIDQSKPVDELLETSSIYNEYIGLIDQNPDDPGVSDTEPEEKPDNRCPLVGFIMRIVAYIKFSLSVLSKIFTSII